MIRFGQKKIQILNNLQGDLHGLQNPGRGFYSVYPFSLGEDFDGAYLETTLVEQESICLLEIDLHSFRSEDISKEGLNRLHQILSFFRKREKDLILRFTYDLSGRAMETEPSSLEQIQKHMEQTMKVVQNYVEIVLLIQGLFVGNWGEMHGSRYITDTTLKRLYRTYRLSEAGSIYLAVRTPQQVRLLLEENPGIRQEMQRRDSQFYEQHLRHLDKVTIFDDAILSDATDMGTFLPGTEIRELEFVQKQLIKPPVGGEVLKGKEDIPAEDVVLRLRNMHINYLNSQYDRQILKQWMDMSYQEENLYTYVEDHMGYRIHLDRVVWDKRGDTLEITVTNEGFGGLLETADCRALIERMEVDEETQNVTYTIEQQCNYRVRHASLKGGDTVTWVLPLKNIPKGKYVLSLTLRRLKDGRRIYWSNANPEETLRVPME